MGPGGLAALVLAASVLCACGGDGRGDADETETVPASSSSVPSAEAVACEQGLTAGFPDGSTVPLDTATGAVRLAEGAAYTLYAGDYEIPADEIGTEVVVPPAGQHLVTLAITVYNAESTPPPIEPGTEVDYTSEFGELTFSVVANVGEQTFGSAEDASGSLTVEAVDEESICVSVDYRDAEKSLQGTVGAAVVDLRL